MLLLLSSLLPLWRSCLRFLFALTSHLTLEKIRNTLPHNTATLRCAPTNSRYQPAPSIESPHRYRAQVRKGERREEKSVMQMARPAEAAPCSAPHCRSSFIAPSFGHMSLIAFYPAAATTDTPHRLPSSRAVDVQRAYLVSRAEAPAYGWKIKQKGRKVNKSLVLENKQN